MNKELCNQALGSLFSVQTLLEAKKKHIPKLICALSGPEGLEPPTYCLEGSCSIQMSYGPKVL